MARKKTRVSSTPAIANVGSSPASPAWPALWPYLLLAVLSFAIYAGTLANGFVTDDDSQLLKNPVIVDYHKIPLIFRQDVWAFNHEEGYGASNYYRPLQMIVYMAVYYAVGFNAMIFHLLMILLHVANTLLVYRLAQHLIKPRFAALAAAVLFAVHPIHSENVCWIAVLPDLLITMAALVLLLLFHKHAAEPRKWQIAAYVVIFFAAILTKETAVMILPLLVGYEWILLERNPRKIVRNWPLYFSLGVAFAVYLLMRLHALGSLAPGQGYFHTLAPGSYVLSAIVLLGTYIAKLFLPLGLCAFYVFTATQTINLAVIGSLLALAAMAAGFLYYRKRVPLVSYALFFILVPLIPVLNISGLGQAVFAERYLYLPSVGFALIVGLAWEWLYERRKELSLGVAAAVVVLSSGLVISRVPDWHDNISVRSKLAEQEPDASDLRGTLGELYLNTGKFDKALVELEVAARLDPGNPIFHNNLGIVLTAVGQPQEGVAEFKRSIAARPHYAPAYFNLGRAYNVMSDAASAEAAYKRSIEIKPTDAKAYLAIAKIHARAKDFEGAIEWARKGVATQPDYADAYFQLGQVLQDAGKGSEAILAYRRALELQPDMERAREALQKIGG